MQSRTVVKYHKKDVEYNIEYGTIVQLHHRRELTLKH